MELLRYFEAFLVIFLSLLPSLLDVGVQVWNVVSVNTMFKHTKCKDPTGSIAHGNIYCDGNSRSLVCDVECMPGYVPSYGGSRSVCTHGDWSTGVKKMQCDQGLVIIAGGSLQGVCSEKVEVYGPDGFYFPNLPNSSIFTGQSGELIDATDSTLEYVGDDVLLCGSSQQQLADHCLGVRKQEDWRLHSALRKNRTQALSTVLKNKLILLAGDGESNNSTEYLNPGSLEWRDGFALDHPISGACVEKFNSSSFVVVESTRGVTIYNMNSGIENVIGSENIIDAPTNMDPSTQFDCKVFQRYSQTLLMLVQGDSKLSWTMDLDSYSKTWTKVSSQFTFSRTVHLEIFNDRVHLFGEKKDVLHYNADRARWENATNQLANQRSNYATAVIPRTWFTEQKHVKDDTDDEEDSKLNGKIFFSIPFTANFSIDVTYVAFVSVVLVQLPGFCLAFHGIGIAFINLGLSKAALKDAGLSILFIFYPFFLVEILAMFEILWEEVLGKISGTVVMKLAAIAGIKNILKHIDYQTEYSEKQRQKTKVMWLLATKVYFGSCLQFCFQAILYFGYTSTEDRSITQVLSLVSSGIMIIKLGTDAFLFQRKMKSENEETKKVEPDQGFCASIWKFTMDKKAFVIEKIDKFKAEDKGKYFNAKFQDLVRYLSCVPLVATGAIFHMGCLILSSLVLKEFAGVYILAVFLSNLVCLFFPPLLLVQRGLDRIPLKSNDPLKYTADKAKNDEKEIREKIFSEGLFMCWSNIFMTSRIVENISYIRFIYFLIFQPIHFIINIIILITCVSINPSTITGSASLAAVGIIHIVILLLTFYMQFLEKGKRKAETNEDFRNVKLKKTTGCFTCGIFAKKRKVEEGSGAKSKARNGKTETSVNIQQNK